MKLLLVLYGLSYESAGIFFDHHKLKNIAFFVDGPHLIEFLEKSDELLLLFRNGFDLES
jgi:hypothetical protein